MMMVAGTKIDSVQNNRRGFRCGSVATRHSMLFPVVLLLLYTAIVGAAQCCVCHVAGMPGLMTPPRVDGAPVASIRCRAMRHER